jgi:hypothetical protein
MTDRALSREWVHARMTKLVMCSIFSLAVAAVLPACTSLERMTATASAETVTMTNTPTDQLDNKEARKEGAAYNGNWGYTPGNGLDDEWGRKSGVLDANSPGCPFKRC